MALSLSLFTWIVAMNTMDLLPLDLPSNIAGAAGFEHAFWRILPTADLMGTLALALVVLVLLIVLLDQGQGLRRLRPRVAVRAVRRIRAVSPSTSS